MGNPKALSRMKLGSHDETGKARPEVRASILAICTNQEEIVVTYLMPNQAFCKALEDKRHFCLSGHLSHAHFINAIDP
jgi:hypothetical protein